MKCPNCGYENKDTAKYCIKCGTLLAKPDDAAINIAFLYTANKAAAEKLAAASEDYDSLRRGCIQWIRDFDPGLFQDSAAKDDSPVIDHINNWDTDLISMDYEQRICTLLHIHDRMSIKEISSYLNIPEEQVVAILQQAYKKTHVTEEQPTIPLPEIESKPKKKHFPAKRMRQIFMYGLLGAVVVILSIFLGVRNYASGEYQKGMDAYNNNDYETAVDSFSKALHFGYEEDVEKQLGNAYAQNNDLNSAAASWRSYYDEHQDDTEVRRSLIQAYEKLADEKLDEGNINDAREMLQNEYEINASEYVNLRLKALDNSGIVRDEDNNEFNSYGQPLRLSNDVYSLTFTYDSDHHLTKITASTGVNTYNTTLRNFDFTNDNTTYIIDWINTDQDPLWRTDQIIAENGSISKETIKTDTDNYTKTYHNNRYTDSEGNSVTVKTQTDDNGRVVSIVETLGNKTIKETDYQYNNEVYTCTQMNITSQDDPDPTVFTPSAYTVKSILADDCHIYRQEIDDEDGKVIGKSWYIPYNGMVNLYERGEE